MDEEYIWKDRIKKSMQTSNKNLHLAQILLRVGLACVFLYAGIAAFITPTDWIGFIPNFLEVISEREVLLPIFSIFEIIVGLWLLLGKGLFWSSSLSSAAILGIIITNLSLIDLTFRDIGLFFSSLALTVLSKKYD